MSIGVPSSSEAEKALANLEELARRQASPSHYVARHVLLAVGHVLREGAPGSCDSLLERARVAGRAAGPAWDQAVQTELTLACGEFAQGLDPRYLGLPDYDLDYTRSARARLADRLRVAKELGFELTAREKEVLELADRVLAGHIARQGPDGTERDSPPPAGAAPSHD